MSKPLGTTGLYLFEDKFPGIYRGTVVDNADPLQLGRAKVRVYPMFADISAEAIPWAIPMSPVFEGSGVGVGYFAVPKVDANVYVFFDNGSPYQPIMVGEALDAVHGLPPERLVNYPNRKVWKTTSGISIWLDDTSKTIDLKTPAGIEVQLDDQTGYMSIKHPTGAYIKIDPLGQILLRGTNISIYTAGYTNWYSSGNVSMRSSGSINVTGGQVHINPPYVPPIIPAYGGFGFGEG